MKAKKMSIKRTLLRMKKHATSQEEVHILNMWLSEIKNWEKEAKANA